MPIHVQDRRGVNFARNLAGLMAAISLFSFIFVSALVGLLCMGLAIFIAISWEMVTRPPINNPGAFLKRFREMSPVRPVLVCVGDSLTHGTLSDNWIPKVPPKIAEKMKFDKPQPSDFMDPVWIVNNGQNAITSYTVLQSRLQSTMACYPDYVLLMIGTNDVLSMYSPAARADKVSTWGLPEAPSMDGFRRNIKGIVDFLVQASNKTQIGLCTLPPLGEELSSPANKLIKEANEIIHEVGESAGDNVMVLQVGERMQDEIAKNNNGGKGSMKPEMMAPLMMLFTPLYLFLGVPLKALSGIAKNCVLSDCVHLNESGGDIMADVVCEWLFMKNIHKAIAVKQF